MPGLEEGYALAKCCYFLQVCQRKLKVCDKVASIESVAIYPDPLEFFWLFVLKSLWILRTVLPPQGASTVDTRSNESRYW